MGCQPSRQEWVEEGHDTEGVVTEGVEEEPPPATLPTGGPLSAKDYKSRITTSEGVQSVTFPTSGFAIKYAYCTLRGLYPDSPDKANQDSLCALPQFGGDSEQILFGVFDGHGEYGDVVSQFARDKVPENLLANTHFVVSPETAYMRAMVATNLQLRARHDIDDSMSGTTAIAALLRGRTIYVANVGDSRAVIAERKGDRLIAQDLSFDQTPFRRDECDRVKRCGARVLTLDQLEGLKDPTVECWGEDEGDNDGDPPRLWAPNATYPGTAFTRSIGDATAERIGVFAEPEVVSKTLHSEHSFLVIASDGVWEFLSSQSVVDMVSKFDDPQDACLSVIAESYRLWLANDTRTDDITMMVIQFSGLQPEVQTTAMPTPLGAMMDFSTRPVARRKLGRWVEHPPIEPLDSSASAQWAQGAKRQAPGASARSAGQSQSQVIVAWQPLPATSLTPGVTSPESSSSLLRLPGVSFAVGGPLLAPTAGPGPATLEQFEFLERAVARHFLFAWLHPEQRRVVLGLFQQTTVSAGDLIVRQGDSGDYFYAVESGQYDVYFYQPGAEQPEHVHTYETSSDPSKRPVSFGDLALMHCKPRAASVLARTDGVMWTLQRSALRQALRMLDWGAHPDLVAVVSVLRGVEVLRCLSSSQRSSPRSSSGSLVCRLGEGRARASQSPHSTQTLPHGGGRLGLSAEGRRVVLRCLSSQLRRVALAMETVEYLEGEVIIHQGDEGSEFFLVRSGQMVCSVCKSAGAAPQVVLRLAPGQYFGEKALVAPAARATTVSAAVLSEQREVLARKNTAVLGGLRSGQLSLDDLDPRGVLFSADVSAMMLMEHRTSEAVMTVRMTSVQDATALRRQPLVLRARDITRSLEPSFFVPGVLKSFKDDRVLAEVLTTVGLCTLDMLLTHDPLDERSSAFVAASVLLGLEHLHWSDVVYRGLAASTIVVTEAGQVQLVDFRFAVRSSGRAYTLCGHPEYLAPEVVQGRGHDESADLWSLGVLVFRMLSGRPPFAAPGDDEMRVYRRIVAGKAPALPASVSPAGADLVRRLLVKDPSARLGTKSPLGMRDLKAHAWFAGVDWDVLQAHQMSAPKGIRELIYLFEGTPSAPCDPNVCDAESSWIQAF
ncbi:hypothetical protein FOA52_008239 [Chlamydomonas sp. UWO 241]|nr:hypothetical protein FOA52_008239 [Chlamydomonas sp. UWO 241]